MQRQLSPEALARDGRFHRITTAQRFADERPGLGEDRRWIPVPRTWPIGPGARCTASSSVRSRRCKVAGRTAYDYAVGEVPFGLKLDMARQCWDEARHVEISIKLGDHMGTEIGEYSEAVTLFEAACHPGPGVPPGGREPGAFEGLAIDVFTTMRDFGDKMGDPVLRFAKDWMLADEVTHVKMGSTWLRRSRRTTPSAASAPRLPEDGRWAVQLPGLRGEDRESAIRLARRFRELAGSTPTRSTPSPPKRRPSGPTGSHHLRPEPPRLPTALRFPADQPAWRRQARSERYRMGRAIAGDSPAYALRNLGQAS